MLQLRGKEIVIINNDPLKKNVLNKHKRQQLRSIGIDIKKFIKCRK